MEDYSIAYEKRDFLVLSYNEIDFFVNRDQFSASTSLENIKEIKSPIRFINSVFRFNGQNILLFDCDSFLKTTYNCSEISPSRLCLLMKPDNFTENGRGPVEKLLSSNEAFSKEFIGLIISSHSEIAKIAIHEIFLSPVGIRNILSENGLYGCRFPEPDKIQYFIDLETVLINVLKGREE